MDYQTFNSHNPSFGGQFASAPQHSQFDPQARLQQSNPSFPYGQFPNGQPAAFPAMGGAMAGSVMQPGMPQNPRGKPVMCSLRPACPTASCALVCPPSPSTLARDAC